MIRRAMFLPDADPALVDRVARAMSSVNGEHALAIRAAYANYDPGVAYAALGAIPLVMINAALRSTDADGIRGVHPNSRFWIMPNVGHFLMLERPDAFNAILAAELVAFAGQAQPT
jgi:pimeloyl-ACP methyl ester carboxylesterase